MPFTPLHLGPGLALGLAFKKRMHAPTFIIANVIIDIEPFLILVLRLRYPLHGYMHTLIAAILLGLALGYIMFALDKLLNSLWKALLLIPEKPLSLKSFSLAGISGTLLHVLLDSPLYSDIKPLYPLKINPLYNPSLAIHIMTVCMLMGALGTVYYITLFTKLLESSAD
ncbi:MAG: hydrolase [archaeon GB-1867-005]|nr:hydrolase [Candidatus Culexmicrobium cathedralense]